MKLIEAKKFIPLQRDVFYYFSNSVSDFLGFPWWHNTVQRYCMCYLHIDLDYNTMGIKFIVAQ
jgi:hypothetical protein